MPRTAAALLIALVCSSLQAVDTTATSAVAHYAAVAEASYARTTSAAQVLLTTVRAFASAPTAAGLDACKTAYTAARRCYNPTEIYRFSGGPIDNDRANYELLINAWPLDENCIDAVANAPGAGLINDEAQSIAADTLVALNQQHGEKNVTTGFHAIEFLLWGQDQSATGPGARPFQDFVDGAAAHAERRRAYLIAVSELLVQHLHAVAVQWAPGAAHRIAIEQDPARAVRNMFTGIISMAADELSGERIATGFLTRDQEEEHSCFSDQTTIDIIDNAEGIVGIWLGRSDLGDERDLGTGGLRALVMARDAAGAARVDRAIADMRAAAHALPQPFDEAIRSADGSASRAAVQRCIETLEVAAQALAAVATPFGVDVTAVGANPNTALLELAEVQAIARGVAAQPQAAWATTAIRSAEVRLARIGAALEEADPAGRALLAKGIADLDAIAGKPDRAAARAALADVLAGIRAVSEELTEDEAAEAAARKAQ